ncbi:MAG: hypothetical protein KA761_00335 [Gemmatimonadaceae bacterium]|nr:hypothetical protein [Gemmatimonadaceae bacterium]
MVPRNHTTHAVEELDALLASPERADAALGLLGHDDLAALRYLRAALVEAPKFLLPDHGRIIENRGASIPNELRLPYPMIVVEYDAPLFTDNAPDKFRSSRRVCLATEPGPGSIAEPGEVLIWPMFWMDDLARWSVSPFAGVASMDPPTATIIDGRVRLHGPASPVENADGRRLTLRPAFSLPNLHAAASRLPPGRQDKLMADAVWDLGEEACAVAGLIEALACSNVEHRTLGPAPAKLNAKRARSGKPPIFEYRVLTIEASSRAAGAPRAPLAGDRASPRQHLRRGHIRRLDGGRTVFVRPAMVGDAARGALAKDYRLR